MAPDAAPKDGAKDKAKDAAPEVVAPAVAVEEEDVFEEFSSSEWTATDAQTDAVAPLWEPHWDDEDAGVDFQLRLKEELDRGMKE